MQSTFVEGNKTYTSLSDPRISTFVEQQAKGMFYYSQAWLELITNLYGYSVISLTTTNSTGQITGFLPLCSIRSPLTGHRLVSFPFTDHCPLLAVDEVSANDLVNQAIRLAQKQKVKYLELRAGVNDVLAKRSDMVTGGLYVRWLTPLKTDSDAVWSTLDKPVRKKIKKSQRLGVQVRLAQDREEMVRYYRIHVRTRRKHGMPAQPLHFFLSLWDTFAADEKMQLLLAEYEGSIIGGLILLVSGTTVRGAYSASDERYLNLAPNNLLLWTALSWGCKQGYQVMDHGRTACDNEGLMDFKRRWGAIQEPLPYYYYPHTAGLAATSESSWKFRLLTTCWQRLPLQVAGPLGGYLYKHLG
jgi:FemAB-related protein (PEP-CTERM system-associated)